MNNQKQLVNRRSTSSKGTSSVKGNSKNVVRYTKRPIIPAEKPELLSVANAMHGKKFGKRLQKLFKPETDAALRALRTGIYIGWRLPNQTWDCIRVGDESRCFCGHSLKEHVDYKGPKSLCPCTNASCYCPDFSFIPSRPEDVGEFWLQRRPNFDPTKWRAKCGCKHPHTSHKPTGLRSCNECSCVKFESNFLCVACDKHWEEHETCWDMEYERKAKGLPYGDDYIPFAEMPNLRDMALTGKVSQPEILPSASSSSSRENELLMMTGSKAVINNSTPFRPNPK